MSKYIHAKIHMVLISLVLIGAINWGIVGLFGFSVLHKLSNSAQRVIYTLIGVCGILLALERNTYLPFLGESVYPCTSLVENSPSNADTVVTVSVPPNAVVVYWAAEPQTEPLKLNDPWTAYSKFENTGVAHANSNGEAILRVRRPQPYQVGWLYNRVLIPHIHFRFCDGSGMMSEVKTVILD